MPSAPTTVKLLDRIGPLRRLPLVRLLAAAEILVLARDHVMMLEPHERRRVLELIRQGRGRRRNLSPRERDELEGLVAKAHPRLFAGLVADKLSPVRLPKRVVRGPKQR
jgi:hypothetical protein